MVCSWLNAIILGWSQNVYYTLIGLQYSCSSATAKQMPPSQISLTLHLFHYFLHSCTCIQFTSCDLAQRSSFKDKLFDVWIFYCFPFQGLVWGKNGELLCYLLKHEYSDCFPVFIHFFHFCIFQSQRISISKLLSCRKGVL